MNMQITCKTKTK